MVARIPSSSSNSRRKASRGCSPFFDLSAGELPLQRHGLVARALAHQQLAVFNDEACDDALHGSVTLAACSALATGSTQLVKVKANAATPVEAAQVPVRARRIRDCPDRKYMRAESTIDVAFFSRCSRQDESAYRVWPVSASEACRLAA